MKNRRRGPRPGGLFNGRVGVRFLPALFVGGYLGACGGGEAPADAEARSMQARDGSVAAPATRPPEVGPALTDSTFAELVVRLSEPGGYFDTDNLISNESSYLHAVDWLDSLGVRGGVYLGVGPDQNFSYMAAVRPELAFIVDLRRDNLLQHLLFRALFEAAESRAEYLALWLGREVPDEPLEGWESAGAEALVAAIDAAETGAEVHERARRRVDREVEGLSLDLSPEDRQTIRRFHDTFMQAGLDLRFQSHGRPPQPYYPTLRQLVLETDRTGRHASYLASEADWRFVRELEVANRVIPVVGDLAGPHAVRAIGDEIERRGLEVSALYTSNVEFYLWRAGTFGEFAGNVAALPRDLRSVIIRSWFHRFRGDHPKAVSGYPSTQLVQSMADLVESWAAYRSYRELIREGWTGG